MFDLGIVYDSREGEEGDTVVNNLNAYQAGELGEITSITTQGWRIKILKFIIFKQTPWLAIHHDCRHDSTTTTTIVVDRGRVLACDAVETPFDVFLDHVQPSAPAIQGERHYFKFFVEI